MSDNSELKQYGISTLKGLISAIPYAGGLLNEVIFEARSRLKQDRVNNFIEEFGEYVSQQSESNLKLHEINSDQIGDVFEEILISVSKTSAEHKKEIFKKILLNQLTSNEIGTDETVRYINITNELTQLQYKILLAFSSLSDNVLKYKIQILLMEAEAKQLRSEMASLEEKETSNGKTGDKIRTRIKQIQKLTGSKRKALQNGFINPNIHTTFDISREVYITEIQDLIAKGLLFDFALKAKVVDPYVHFGITNFGRNYMKYIAS